MTLFRVTYPNKTSADTESSDCDTVERFANTHFGCTYAEAQAHGASVEIVEPGTPLPRDPSLADATGEELRASYEGEVLSGAEVVAEVTGEPAPAPVKAKAKKK